MLRDAIIKLANENPELRKYLIPILKKAEEVFVESEGKNLYFAMYKGKKINIKANTQLEAQQKAAKYFKARKSYDVTVMLLKVGDREVIHTPDF